MSTCISMSGEYSDHELTNEAEPFLCQRCFAFAEDAATAEVRRLRGYVGAWVIQLRDLMEQHKEFTGDEVSLIDETGLHYSLASELDDLRAIVSVPLSRPAEDGA